jgi:1-aminocyclopropane-1-carboxylate deaminase
MSLSDFPRRPLLFGPSPVHPLERLSARLGGARIWAKRDDCNSGLAFGGNKTRKLEYLVPDALAQGADTLVSIGGVQSNHTRQVAAVAARLGLKAVLVQESWVDWPDPVSDRVGNILLSRIMGADVRLVDAGFGIGFKTSWEQALEDVRAAGGTPYAIPAGASDHRLGGLGFANWAWRLLRHPGAIHARRDPAGRQPRRRHPRPGLRGQVHGRPARPGPHRRDRTGLDRALRPSRRPARAQRLQRPVPLAEPSTPR